MIILGIPANRTLTFIPLTTEGVLAIIKTIKPKCSLGIDQISNKILKLIAPVIIVPLVHVFNLSLCNGYIHETFKTSIIKPLYKTNAHNDFTNYRPISILSAMAKAFEKCVCKQLCRHLELNNLLYKYQFGFRPNHCTAQAILKFCENIHNAWDDDRINLTVFIDLKKSI